MIWQREHIPKTCVPYCQQCPYFIRLPHDQSLSLEVLSAPLRLSTRAIACKTLAKPRTLLRKGQRECHLRSQISPPPRSSSTLYKELRSLLGLS